MASTVRSFTLSGIEGHVVEVETDVSIWSPFCFHRRSW